jgi:transposase
MTEDLLVTSQSSEADLPDDARQLKQMVLMLLGQIDDLQGQLLYLKKQMFGKKSEKYNRHQLLMFQDLYNELQGKLQTEQPKPPKRKRTRANANHQGRKPLPEDLPRDTVEIEPSDAEKICPDCRQPKQRMGEEVTEKLDYIPASFRVQRIVRPKYACKHCQNNVAIAELPPMAIDKGIPAEGLLAHVITSKYADHLPLNRLEGIAQRHGIDITVSTMCDWVARCADLLAPLIARSRDKILASPKVHCDATVVPVKSRKRKGSTYNGYLWAYIGTGHDVVFDFTPSQSRDGPNAFFENYAGYVQVDAHSSFNDLFQDSTNMTEVGCHAHARRKFDQAMEHDPVRASQALSLWQSLYQIEKQAKAEDVSPEALLEVRQEKAIPLLEQLHECLMAWQPQVLPKTPIGKAVTYSMNQWEALKRYTQDPILSIDNNLAERTLRMVALGRKNWLFAGSENGAKRAAVIYSLVASCKLCGHDPYAYFRDVLTKISTHPAHQIDELLPSLWTKPTSD